MISRATKKRKMFFAFLSGYFEKYWREVKKTSLSETLQPFFLVPHTLALPEATNQSIPSDTWTSGGQIFQTPPLSHIADFEWSISQC